MAEPTLEKGSRGQAVKDLQAALHELGFDAGAADGIFGARTERAVKDFQEAHGIEVDGICGPITWLNIDEADQSEPLLRRGSTGLPVRRLQRRLSAVGFDTGGIDGIFGAKTERAVKELQEQRGDLDVDGIVGPETWAVVDALESEGAAA